MEKLILSMKNNPVRAMTFNRRKIATQIVASKNIISDMKFESGLNADNFIKDELTHQVSAYIYDRMLHEQRIVREFCAPTFTDWLFKRKRRFSFVVKAYEVLKGVKRIDSTEIIYLIEQ